MARFQSKQSLGGWAGILERWLDALIPSHLFLLLCVRMSITQHTRSTAMARHTLGYPGALPFQDLGSLLFPVDGSWGSLLGKSPSFYCSKS